MIQLSFEEKMSYYMHNRSAIKALKGNGSLEDAIEKHYTSQQSLRDQQLNQFVEVVMTNTIVNDPIDKGNGKFLKLDDEAEDLFSLIKAVKTIFFVKPVQAGKTSEVFKILEQTYKYSCTVMISTLTAVAGQTKSRGRTTGWEIVNFTDFTNQEEIIAFLHKGCGKKKAIQCLMEITNVRAAMLFISLVKCPITLIIDEGDKNRSTDKTKEERKDKTIERGLPPVTRALQVCKNRLAKRNDGSKTIYVTATPVGLFTAEKDEDRLTIVKEPFKNWQGVAHNHPCNIEVLRWINPNKCKAGNRWDNSSEDHLKNSYREPVRRAVKMFEELETKDETITQVMLISLETGNVNQENLAKFVKSCLEKPKLFNVIIFNGLYKEDDSLLSDLIDMSYNRKTIVIAGIMASRGISFTDYSNTENKFELVVQVHAAKNSDAIGTSIQAMRIYGPPRKTVSRPTLVCNDVTYKDNKYNILEYYRIVEDLARGIKSVRRGSFDPDRKLVAEECCHYMEQSTGYNILQESMNPKRHLPINTITEVLALYDFGDTDDE